MTTKKTISLKVHLEGHYREKFIPAHIYTDDRYPMLNLCFHRTLIPTGSGDFKLSRKHWTLSNVETGMSLFERSETKINLKIRLQDLIKEIGIEAIQQKIEAAKSCMETNSLESVLWTKLHKYGLTLTQTEVFDFIAELEEQGVEIIYYALEESQSHRDN